ncbi:MAG: hypothetical protein IKQ85_01100 [Bacteroidaceae bacterium]|nr:hypothetical protein [Bacteroidaceae bacterium]
MRRKNLFVMLLALILCSMEAWSYRITDKSGTNSIQHSSDILVKEQNTSDVNLWDNQS